MELKPAAIARGVLAVLDHSVAHDSQMTAAGDIDQGGVALDVHAVNVSAVQGDIAADGEHMTVGMLRTTHKRNVAVVQKFSRRLIQGSVSTHIDGVLAVRCCLNSFSQRGGHNCLVTSMLSLGAQVDPHRLFHHSVIPHGPVVVAAAVPVVAILVD